MKKNINKQENLKKVQENFFYENCIKLFLKKKQIYYIKFISKKLFLFKFEIKKKIYSEKNNKIIYKLGICNLYFSLNNINIQTKNLFRNLKIKKKDYIDFYTNRKKFIKTLQKILEKSNFDLEYFRKIINKHEKPNTSKFSKLKNVTKAFLGLKIKSNSKVNEKLNKYPQDGSKTIYFDSIGFNTDTFMSPKFDNLLGSQKINNLLASPKINNLLGSPKFKNLFVSKEFQNLGLEIKNENDLENILNKKNLDMLNENFLNSKSKETFKNGKIFNNNKEYRYIEKKEPVNVLNLDLEFGLKKINIFNYSNLLSVKTSLKKKTILKSFLNIKIYK